MPTLRLTRALANQVQGPLERDLVGATVQEALDALFQTEPILQRYLLDDNGALRTHVNVFVNDALLPGRDLTTPLAASDRIAILQAISGGAQGERQCDTSF